MDDDSAAIHLCLLSFGCNASGWVESLIFEDCPSPSDKHLFDPASTTTKESLEHDSSPAITLFITIATASNHPSQTPKVSV